MPNAPLRFCLEPGCGELVASGRCSEHDRGKDRERGTARQRGYDSKWDRTAKAWLRAKVDRALCCYCLEEGRTTAAECVDHNPPHKGDMKKFWDKSTWRASCLACNTRRAIQFEGGFGRRPRRT